MQRRTIVLGIIAIAAGLAIAGAVMRGTSSSHLLAVGAKAPTLSGVDQNGQTRSLKAGPRDGYLVVYFYPKDGTPGCTAEACAFRDVWLRYEQAGVSVYGVSADSQDSHASFGKEHSVPFPLIVDPDNLWARAFGVGMLAGLTERVTFVVAPNGLIAAQYPDVDPGVHAKQLLKDIAAMSAKR